jgi:hypothetical protein
MEEGQFNEPFEGAGLIADLLVGNYALKTHSRCQNSRYEGSASISGGKDRWPYALSARGHLPS